jgi:hypothetical protein
MSKQNSTNRKETYFHLQLAKTATVSMGKSRGRAWTNRRKTNLRRSSFSGVYIIIEMLDFKLEYGELVVDKLDI